MLIFYTIFFVERWYILFNFFSEKFQNLKYSVWIIFNQSHDNSHIEIHTYKMPRLNTTDLKMPLKKDGSATNKQYHYAQFCKQDGTRDFRTTLVSKKSVR